MNAVAGAGPRRAWGTGEQRRLVTALRAGCPPARVCEELGRDPDEVRERLAFLLGDVHRQVVPDAACHLDLLWLRVRSCPPRPAPLTTREVASLWTEATGIRLTSADLADLAEDPALPPLAGAGRHALATSAASVVARTGGLDLDDWCAAAARAELDAETTDEGPTPTSGTETVRTLVRATVSDVGPRAAREALHRHLLPVLSPSPETTNVATTPSRHRRAGLLDAARAALTPGRPAALLQDALAAPGAVEALATGTTDADLSLLTSLATLGGRSPSEALRFAGHTLTPWRRPPNLGRGFAIRTPSSY